MKAKGWCQTDVGLRRENNQDSVLVDEDLGLFIVADGMGGHRGGEVASQIAVETMRDYVRKSLKDNRRMNPRIMLAAAYREASHRIFDKSQVDTDLQGMGTTLVAAFFHQNVLFIANVGDSRAYLFKRPHLWQLTEDHSLVNEQLRAGLINERDAANFTAKNVITRSVGFERDVLCDIIERNPDPEELFMLCSDGLSGLVPDTRIAEIFNTYSPSQAVSQCIDEAKKNGGDDNVSVLVVSVSN